MKTKLTSVKILTDLYIDFKHTCLDGDMNLQKLVNRTVFLYINDEEYRNKMDITDTLQVSGSKL